MEVHCVLNPVVFNPVKAIKSEQLAVFLFANVAEIQFEPPFCFSLLAGYELISCQ